MKNKIKYKTGVHRSPKCKQAINYRSSYEKAVAEWLDFDKDVVEYEYETYSIDYKKTDDSEFFSKYIPDFLVEYENKVSLIEVKNDYELWNDPEVLRKATAGRKWCKQLDIHEYDIWSDKKINEIRKIMNSKEGFHHFCIRYGFFCIDKETYFDDDGGGSFDFLLTNQYTVWLKDLGITPSNTKIKEIASEYATPKQFAINRVLYNQHMSD